MDRGAIISGVGHLGLILWVILGDWLVAPSDLPPIEVAQVSLIATAEYDAMVASAPKAEVLAPKPAAEPVAEPLPAVPVETAAPPAAAPEAVPELLPEILPVDAVPQPIEAPEPTAPLAEEAQPIPVPNLDQAPAPRPIDRVADVPVDQPTDAPEIAETPTPEVSDTAAPDAPVIETPAPEAAPEEATTQIVTEAVETEVNAPQLAPTASRRPQARPEAVAETSVEAPPAPVADTNTNDAIALALAEAVAEPPSETGGQTDAPEGPPMTAGEIEDMRVAVKACWNLGTLSSDAMRVTVTVRLSVGQDGTPDTASIRMAGFEGGDDAAAKRIYDTARRAIIRCGKTGFPLPPAKYETWKELELVFDPNGMRLR